ncbi:MAG TPA: thioredoxin domain-containing protein [Gaiellaceae bacterium]|nr:thioredoxin domain-containing protein [Gaiellaceae bacterium]
MNRRLLVGSLAAAVLLAGGLAAALTLSGGGSKTAATTVVDSGPISRLLDGLPQHGAVLGEPSAPVTLVEFADPQCPYCAAWAEQALPTIVRKYVRTGKVRLVFNGMAFVGPDSETALRTALAAGRQNRLWNVIDLLFANQGTENTGWVTESLLRSIGATVSGLDVERMLDERSSDAVDRALGQAGAFARSAGVNMTPSFAVGKTGGTLQVVRISSLDPTGLTPSLDAALGS